MKLLTAARLLIVSAAPLIAQTVPPVRPIGPITKVSAAGVLGSVSMVRVLPHGGVLVNDLQRRQLVLLNADLAKVKIVADTSAATERSYGSQVAGLLAFKGDSLLFIDPSSLSMLVIDAQGAVVRVLAVPRPKDAVSLIGGPFGTPAMDSLGRVVSRSLVTPPTLVIYEMAPAKSKLRAQSDDSAFVYRIDLATRAVDTIAWVKVPVARSSMSEGQQGRRQVVSRSNPLPIVDDWSLMPDGRVAVVRGADFHVDWIGMDGRVASSPKIPHPWERLTDDAKQQLLDSLKTADRLRAEARKGNRNDSGASSRSVGGEGPQLRGIVVTGQLVGDLGRERPRPIEYASEYVPPSELPDYRPAFRLGATRADLDGNLWVRTTIPGKAGAIYDVINGNGELVDRVRLPFGRVLSGFGPGVVYLGVLDDRGARLQMARLK